MGSLSLECLNIELHAIIVASVASWLVYRRFQLPWPEFVAAAGMLAGTLVLLVRSRRPPTVRETFEGAEQIARDTLLPSLDRLINTLSASAADADPEQVDVDAARYPDASADDLARTKLEFQRANFFLCLLKHYAPEKHSGLMKALGAPAGEDKPTVDRVDDGPGRGDLDEEEDLGGEAESR
jgi:hypothetical protein